MFNSEKLKVFFKKYLFNSFTIIVLLIFFTLVITLPKGGLQGDLNYWIRWVQWMRDLGLSHIYTIGEVNYFPVYLYLLYILSWLIKDMAVLAANIYLIKIFILAFDIGSIILTGYLFKKFKLSPFLSFFILFNLAFFFNSLLWGQIESLYIFFVLASILAALGRHTILSLVLYVFAFYSKLQAVVFLPVLFLLWMQLFLQHRNRKKLLIQAFLVFIASQAILLFPFILSGSVGHMFGNVLRSVDMFPVLSNNAFNFWVLLFGGNNMYMPDSNTAFVFSYKTWGILLFGLISIIVFFPFLLSLLKKRGRKKSGGEIIYNAVIFG